VRKEAVMTWGQGRMMGVTYIKECAALLIRILKPCGRAYALAKQL